MPPKKKVDQKSPSPEEVEAAKLAAKLAAEKAAEEKRLKDWEECWERKFREEELAEDCKACCDEDFLKKPRTQSDIWIKVMQKDQLQEVTMCFKNGPVPKKKIPPLPKLDPSQMGGTGGETDDSDANKKGGKKKGGKKKGGKKKYTEKELIC